MHPKIVLLTFLFLFFVLLFSIEAQISGQLPSSGSGSGASDMDAITQGTTYRKYPITQMSYETETNSIDFKIDVTGVTATEIGALTNENDVIKKSMVDFGSGAAQIDLDDIPDSDIYIKMLSSEVSQEVGGGIEFINGLTAETFRSSDKFNFEINGTNLSTFESNGTFDMSNGDIDYGIYQDRYKALSVGEGAANVLSGGIGPGIFATNTDSNVAYEKDLRIGAINTGADGKSGLGASLYLATTSTSGYQTEVKKYGSGSFTLHDFEMSRGTRFFSYKTLVLDVKSHLNYIAFHIGDAVNGQYGCSMSKYGFGSVLNEDFKLITNNTVRMTVEADGDFEFADNALFIDAAEEVCLVKTPLFEMGRADFTTSYDLVLTDTNWLTIEPADYVVSHNYGTAYISAEASDGSAHIMSSDSLYRCDASISASIASGTHDIHIHLWHYDASTDTTSIVAAVGNRFVDVAADSVSFAVNGYIEVEAGDKVWLAVQAEASCTVEFYKINWMMEHR